MLPDRFGYTLYENRQQEEPEIEPIVFVNRQGGSGTEERQ